MQVTFLFIAIIGLTLVIYGIKLLIKELKLKEVAEFDLIDQTKSIDINKTGLYSINFIGIGHKYKFRANKAFDLSIIQPNGKNLKKINPNVNYHFIRKGKICIEIWRFDVIQKGIHRIEFIGLSEFIKKNPFIKSDEFLIKRKFETSKLKVLVKESVPGTNRFLMILSMVIGINAFFWGILIGIKPDLFG